MLGREKIGGVMIEGGPLLHTAFLEHSLVNEVFAYIAPILAGGQASSTFYMGEGVATMNEALRLQRVQRTEFGSDTLIQGVLKR
ncbi:hypothetical protein GF373_13690 [bacterium]|nr:hypothetical protein [bacterium]